MTSSGGACKSIKNVGISLQNPKAAEMDTLPRQGSNSPLSTGLPFSLPVYYSVLTENVEDKLRQTLLIITITLT